MTLAEGKQALDAQSYAQVRRWFDALCDLSPAMQQQAMLDADLPPATRQELERLLQRDLARGGDFTQTPQRIDQMLDALANEALASEVQPSLNVGDAVGPWRVTGVLGKGGMGTVFRAERVDGQFEQTAAIKVLTGAFGQSTPALLSQERSTLASLAHPNIARILDAGLTSDGHAYLAMDCIDGRPIDSYAAKALAHLEPYRSTYAVLALFRTLGEALEHAHQRLVLHCDIKPGNVLVTTDGRPVLLDFGIAQALAVESSTAVELGSAPEPCSAECLPVFVGAFTPNFASPEQIAGQALSTSSDVYALGRLLRVVLRQVRVPPAWQQDCAAIIAKATQEQSQDRYATVAEFSADLRRVQESQPVKALPRSLPYLASKLWQRRRGAVLATGLAAMSAVAFTALLVLERNRAVRAETAALLGLERANTAEQQATAQRDRAQSATQLAEHSASQAKAAFAQSEADRKLAVSATALAQQSAQAALASKRIAVAEAAAAVEAKARAQSAAVLAESARAQSQVDADNALASERLARSERQSSEAVRDFLLSVFDGMHDSPLGARRMTAYELLEKARIELTNKTTGDPQIRSELLEKLARIYDGVGDMDNMKALWLQVAQLERDPQRGRPLRLAAALARVALAESNSANHAAAEPYARESLEIRVKALGPDAREVADSHTSLGLALGGMRRHAQAREHLLACLRIRQTLLPLDESGIASAMHNLGQHHAVAGTHEAGVAYYQQAIDLKTRLHGAEHPSTLNSVEGLGMTLWRANRLADAEPLLAKLHTSQLKVNGPESERTASAATAWGNVLMDLGRYDQAQVALANASAILSKPPLPERSMRYAITTANYGLLLAARGDMPAAIAQLSNAHTVRSKRVRDDDAGLAGLRLSLGRILLQVGNLPQAAQWLERALAVRTQHHKPGDAELADARLALVELRVAQGRTADAAAEWQTLSMPAQPSINLRLNALKSQAALRRAQGDAAAVEAVPAATAMLAERAALAKTALGTEHPRTLEAKLDLAMLLQQSGQTEQATAMAKALQPLMGAFAPQGWQAAQLQKLLN